MVRRLEWGKKKCWLGLLLPLLFLLLGVSTPLSGQEAEEADRPATSEILSQRLATQAEGWKFTCRGQVLCGAPVLRSFYQRRNMQLAWSRNGRLLEPAAQLLVTLNRADGEGLRPADYHLYSIKLLVDRLTGPVALADGASVEELVDLDLLLTDAFLLYGAHLLAGRVDPETIHSEWLPYDHLADLAGILEEALAANRVLAALQDLGPPNAGYRRLRLALFELREIARRGGWPAIAPGFTLQLGMRHRRVQLLRQRLMISGDLATPMVGGSLLFDEELEGAVRRFQRRHGLPSDGVVGPGTLVQLNRGVEKRIEQISLNMERWRWLPHDFGKRYLFVNIADFSLRVVEEEQQVMEMRVVVGRPHRSTPVFSSAVEGVFLNPPWYVPETILVNDLLPKVQADPDYLSRHRIRLFAAGSDETEEIDPATVDWQALDGSKLPYKLRQDPGPFNPLGRLKFLFPNPFQVYLHDTPRQALFNSRARDFSSGCIRVEQPLELATYLLRDEPGWDRQAIEQRISSGESRLVRLPSPLPIHILYLTAWVDGAGELNFRRDIYQRDKLLLEALAEMGPQP